MTIAIAITIAALFVAGVIGAFTVNSDDASGGVVAAGDLKSLAAMRPADAVKSAPDASNSAGAARMVRTLTKDIRVPGQELKIGTTATGIFATPGRRGAMAKKTTAAGGKAQRILMVFPGMDVSMRG